MFDGNLGFCRNDFIGLPVILPSLGMSDNDPGAFDIGQHPCAHFTRKSAGFMNGTVLCADINIECACQKFLLEIANVDKRRTHG